MIWLQKLAFYGCVGMVIEVFFTGIANLVQRHWKATGNTYLWMFFVYGIAGILIETISQAINMPFYFKAFIYLPMFYGIEALSGILIMTVTGHLESWFGGTGGNVIPWEYGKSKWAPFGLINFKYLPAWLLLAMGFDLISGLLRKFVVFLANVPF